MVSFIVYCHTCRDTWKSYVGVTSSSMDSRWDEHQKRAAAGSALAFHCAIRKHGVDAWDHVVLEEHTTWDDALDAEQFFIAYLGTFVPSGYNMTKGGEGGAQCDDARQKMRNAWKKRAPMSEETKRKISESRKGQRPSAETRQKMSTAHRGAKKGPQSEEHRQHMSEALRGRTFTDDWRRKISEARLEQERQRRLVRDGSR